LVREGELEAGLGSGGSNRIRSAVLQTIVRLIAEGMDVAAAVEAPRVHFEAGAVQAEPGIDPDALALLEARGSAACTPSPGIPRRASFAGAVTRGAAARSQSRESVGVASKRWPRPF
jgi:gamma-glutamyltranspeptidase